MWQNLKVLGLLEPAKNGSPDISCEHIVYAAYATTLEVGAPRSNVEGLVTQQPSITFLFFRQDCVNAAEPDPNRDLLQIVEAIREDDGVVIAVRDGMTISGLTVPQMVALAGRSRSLRDMSQNLVCTAAPMPRWRRRERACELACSFCLRFC